MHDSQLRQLEAAGLADSHPELCQVHSYSIIFYLFIIYKSCLGTAQVPRRGAGTSGPCRAQRLAEGAHDYCRLLFHTSFVPLHDFFKLN